MNTCLFSHTGVGKLALAGVISCIIPLLPPPEQANTAKGPKPVPLAATTLLLCIGLAGTVPNAVLEADHGQMTLTWPPTDSASWHQTTYQWTKEGPHTWVHIISSRDANGPTPHIHAVMPQLAIQMHLPENPSIGTGNSLADLRSLVPGGTVVIRACKPGEAKVIK